jgi:hypothetical protein
VVARLSRDAGDFVPSERFSSTARPGRPFRARCAAESPAKGTPAFVRNENRRVVTAGGGRAFVRSE